MPPKGTQLVASNRKVRHDYDVLDTFEAGVALKGSEVKSLRDGKAQLRDSYARIDDGEVWLHSVHIAPYSHASAQGGHDPDRSRKLLLHRRQIDEIAKRLQGEPLVLVPTAIYFKAGRAKVEIALARGRKKHDKRQALAKRDAQREADRAMGRQRRGY